jgi:homoserine dehydrogenase
MSEVLQTSTTEHLDGAFGILPDVRSTRPAVVHSVRVGLLGYGRFGQAVAATADAEQERLEETGLGLTFVRALVRDIAKPRPAPPIRLVVSAESFAVHGLDVLVEVLGGLEPARTIVRQALAAGVPVVTANKTLVAYHGAELSRLAAHHGVAFAYDAAVLAGVPFLGSLARRPLLSGARRLAGIVNGTSHAIATAIERGESFEGALADAVARGYAEPDSSADISGRDAAEKLTILLHLAGVSHARVTDITRVGLEVATPALFHAAKQLGGTIKPVAVAALDVEDNGGAWVGPAWVAADHVFARTSGVTNVLQIGGAAGRHAAGVPDVVFQGPGAGPAATAATIIDDIAEVVAGAAPRRHQASRAVDVTTPPAGAWLVRLTGDDRARLADSDVLTGLGLSVVRSERGPGWTAGLTGTTSWRDIQRATSLARARGFDPLALPALESSAS